MSVFDKGDRSTPVNDKYQWQVIHVDYDKNGRRANYTEIRETPPKKKPLFTAPKPKRAT